uniref:Uncharacterized protein n=1 Tax=Chaetoceros debilis TaxID=122233 RepID=A0A7S3Q030_9STRA
MGLLTENTSNIIPSLDIDSDVQVTASDSLSPTSKRKIQLKLETWQPANPSMEALQTRLNEANLRRENNLSNLSGKASAHIDVVKNVLSERQNQIHQESISIQEKIAAKKKRAVQQKEKLKEMNNIKSQNTFEKISRAKENARIAQGQKAQKIEDKLTKAAERRENLVVHTIVKKSAEVNKTKMKKVEKWQENENIKIQNIEAKYLSKLAAASERKQEVISSVVENNANSTKKKMQRVKLFKDSKDAEVENIQRKLEDKLLTATERKELSIAAKVAKAAEENKAVEEKVQQVQKMRESSVSLIHMKHMNKLESANRRIQRSQNGDRSTPCTTEKIENAKRFKLAQDASLSEIQLVLDEKLKSANERKETNLAAKVAKAAGSNKIVESRLQEAQKKQDKEVSDIERKLNERLLTAAERKEVNLAARVAKVAEANEMVADRVLELQRKREATVQETQTKTKSKHESSNERREKILLEKRGSRSRSQSEASASSSAGLDSSAIDPAKNEVADSAESINDNVSTGNTLKPQVTEEADGQFLQFIYMLPGVILMHTMNFLRGMFGK